MLTSPDFVLLALQIAVMLTFAVSLGSLMRRVRQPAVTGEMLAGIILGPTILGALFPVLYAGLFLSSENAIVAREALIKLGMLFFLFVAGLETNPSNLKSNGQRPLIIGLSGTILPIVVGVVLVYVLPPEFWGLAGQSNLIFFALFIGMNFANSANPVLARILMDMGLLSSEIGSTIMTATIVDDLVNWMLFAILLRYFNPGIYSSTVILPVSLGLVLLFFFVVLVLGSRIGPIALRWIRKYVGWPIGFVGITAVVILIVSSVAEWLGIHAFLGAYLAGVALAKNDAEHHAANRLVGNFALSFFVPIYFVSIGLQSDFFANFDFLLVIVLILAALISKLGSVILGAKIAGLPAGRDTFAIAFGLNARGATGIILANIGLANGIIDERIFVALVVMCLATTFIAGPVMQALLLRKSQRA